MINIEEYFNNYYKGTKEQSLKTMQYFLAKYNNFQEKMKFIHIAGTNGKGSCTEMISNILFKQGYKVGKFISPHLIKYNERIIINNKEIADDEIAKIITELEPQFKQYETEENTKVTFFELITLIAFIHFYRSKVDFVVLETGLGGLYDCTNIINNTLVSVITSIGYDHMKILGNTLPQIAYQKAGIMKENSNTVFFEQKDEINNVLKKVAKEKNNNLHIIKNESITNYSFDNKYQYFDYESYKRLEVVLKGKKQIQNAAICIKCIDIIKENGYKVSEKSIREGLKTVVHKARMETLNKNPLVIFDGAHNEPAIENLHSMVEMYFKDYNRTYIVSILKRKDYKKMIELLLKDERAKFIFTTGNNEDRYTAKEELYNIAEKYRQTNIEKMELTDALNASLKNKDKNCVYFVVGSFYIYKTTLDIIKENKLNSAE